MSGGVVDSRPFVAIAAVSRREAQSVHWGHMSAPTLIGPVEVKGSPPMGMPGDQREGFNNPNHAAQRYS
jgi:hypothetical protein